MTYLNCFLALAISIYTYPPAKYYDECEAVLRAGLLTEDNWTLFSDNFSGKEVFKSKMAFQKTAKISAIPILKFNASEYFRDSTMNLEKYYYLDTTKLIGIISKANKATKAISMRVQRGGATTVQSRKYYLSSGDSDMNVLLHYYNLHYRCIFYDASLHRFCFLSNGLLMVWDSSTNEFYDAQNYYKLTNTSSIKTLISKMQQE